MDDIIKSLSTKLNLPEATVREGVGILLNFIKTKAAGTEFEKFIAMAPGANQAMAASAPGTSTPDAASGLLGSVLGKVGGLLGGDAAAAAEAIAAFQKAGIPLDKAAPLAAGFIDQARQVVGPETVDALLDKMPALKALLK